MVELAQDVDEFRRHRVETAVVLAQRASGVQRYTGDRKLPFEILVDESREVVKAYGVWQRIGLDAWNISRPAVFLIEKDRSIALFVHRPVTRGSSAPPWKRSCGAYLNRLATASQLTTFHQAAR